MALTRMSGTRNLLFMPTITTRRLYAVLLCLLLAAGAVLRLAHLGDPSLWWDECITLGVSLLPIQRMLHMLTVVGPSDIGGEFFPPLYHLLTHAVLTVSRNDAVLRLTSVVCGTATIAVLYILTRDIFSRRAGLFAAALACFSVYQMHYSRELRPYSLFMLLGLLSLLTLHRALTRGGMRRFAAYALVITAMAYTSYMATTNIAAHGLFTAFFLLRGLWRRDFDLKRAMRLGLTLTGCVGVAGLCYLPWMAAYKNVFTLLKTGGGTPGIPADFLVSTLSEFGAYAAPHQGLPWLPLALCGLVGLGAAFRRENRTGLALLGFFAVMPLLAFLAAGTVLEISSRYVFNAFYCLLALAGLGIDAVLGRTLAYLGLSEKNAAWGAPLAGLAVCLLVSAANMISLPTYYRRETSYSKELADYLLWNKNNVDYLFFQSNRNQKFIADWYLPRAFNTLATFAPDNYKRVFQLIQSDLNPAAEPYPPKRLARFQDTTVYAMGLASTAPVVLFPDAAGQGRYTEDFTDYRFYADCDETDNLAPETRYNTLIHFDHDKPGHAIYRFVAAPGTTLRRARLRLEFAAVFLVGIPSDSRITVSVAAGDNAWQVVDTVTGEAFIGPDGALVPANRKKRRFITRSLDLPDFGPDTRQMRLRLDYGPVANPGVIEVTRLELTTDMAGTPTGPGPAEAALWRAAAHSSLAPWQPGLELVAANALFAFPATPGLPQGPANPADRLPDFLAAHPGIEPVFIIKHPDGSPAYLLYDPALTDPFLRLSPGRPQLVRLGQTPPVDVSAVKLSGALARPRLRLGDRALTVPVLAPSPSTLLLDRDGTGILRFEPSFASEAQALAAFPIASNIRKNDGEDCLSCKDPGPCSVTVPISSAYPIKLLRVLAYPRVYADKAGHNTIRIAFSLDGTHFSPLDTLVSNRSGLWEGLMARRMAVLTFPRPIHSCYVRFELSGPGTQLWSRYDTRMRIEAILDAAAFKAPILDPEDVSLTLEENAGEPLSVFLSPRPLPYLPTLQDNY
jgi:hypothetical protein